MRTALVLGGGGFIGHHLVRRLKRDGFHVRAADLRRPEFSATEADEFVLADLRDPKAANDCLDRRFDEVYQLAADMGGAGYIFTGEHDADVMHNSSQINLNVLAACRSADVGRVFFSSSACVYPHFNQDDPDRPTCAESTAIPASPDSEYGWEKLYAERLYLAFARNHGLTCRIARYHNVFGPEGAWRGGREKAPAAVCRKVAMAGEGDTIEVWGDGRQTRSFLYIDECLEGTLRLMRSAFPGPCNVGSDEMVSIDGLVAMVAGIAGKRIAIRHVPGPTGVRGRSSDNRLVREKLGWAPTAPLRDGLGRTYRWIEGQVAATTRADAVSSSGKAS